jgi:hypothetical protein
MSRKGGRRVPRSFKPPGFPRGAVKDRFAALSSGDRDAGSGSDCCRAGYRPKKWGRSETDFAGREMIEQQRGAVYARHFGGRRPVQGAVSSSRGALGRQSLGLVGYKPDADTLKIRRAGQGGDKRARRGSVRQGWGVRDRDRQTSRCRFFMSS